MKVSEFLKKIGTITQAEIWIEFKANKKETDPDLERLTENTPEEKANQVIERASGYTIQEVNMNENALIISAVKIEKRTQKSKPKKKQDEKREEQKQAIAEELTREPKRGTGLRKIIDGKLYDTESAVILFKFRRRYQDPLNPIFFGKNMVHNEWEDAQYLKTERGAYLYYCPKRKDLQVVTENEVKDTIRKLNADAYIRIFGQVEEG